MASGQKSVESFGKPSRAVGTPSPARGSSLCGSAPWGPTVVRPSWPRGRRSGGLEAGRVQAWGASEPVSGPRPAAATPVVSRSTNPAVLGRSAIPIPWP